LLRKLAFLLFAAWTLTVSSASAQRQPPYWASIGAGRALMRVGPGQNYPGAWLYIRPDLPIRVIGVLGDWRRVEDPDGTQGWMLVRLLSDRRTAIVRGQGLAPMYETQSEASPVHFRAQPGVVGRISQCANGWCLFDVGGRRGYIRIDSVWGVDPSEAID
jgi:SH3-like domain-containing protein